MLFTFNLWFWLLNYWRWDWNRILVYWWSFGSSWNIWSMIHLSICNYRHFNWWMLINEKIWWDKILIESCLLIKVTGIFCKWRKVSVRRKGTFICSSESIMDKTFTLYILIYIILLCSHFIDAILCIVLHKSISNVFLCINTWSSFTLFLYLRLFILFF